MSRAELETKMLEVALKPGKSWVADPAGRITKMVDLFWPDVERLQELLREVVDELAAMDCYGSIGSMAPWEDLAGRIQREIGYEPPEPAEAIVDPYQGTR